MSQHTNTYTSGHLQTITGHPAADKTPQVCHTTWEVYIKEKPKFVVDNKIHILNIMWKPC